MLLAGNLQSGVQGRQGMQASVPSLAEMQQRLQGATATTPRPKKIVVLGWRGHVTDLAVRGSAFLIARLASFAICSGSAHLHSRRAKHGESNV